MTVYLAEEANIDLLIRDELKYAIPFGILGRIVHALYVKYDIRSIFKYRQKILDDIFTEIKKQSGN